jgi:hypothetical protein
MLSEYNYEITTTDVNKSWNPTDYKILNDGNGTGTFAKDSSQATVVYMVEYDYVEQFLDVILGKTVPGEDGLLQRSASSPDFDEANGSLPEPHPRYYNFFAASADIKPAGPPSNNAENTAAIWPKAIVTVVFRPVNYNIISDDDYEGDTEIGRYVSKLTESSADLQTINGFFYFVGLGSPAIPLDFNPSIVVASTKVTYTWYQVPTATLSSGFPNITDPPNLSTITGLLGSINSVAIDSYAPGTVLFSTWSCKLIMPQTADLDSYYWDITYVFSVRDYGVSSTPLVTGEHIGWNYAYYGTSGWTVYTRDGTTSTASQYTYQDLNTLFQY